MARFRIRLSVVIALLACGIAVACGSSEPRRVPSREGGVDSGNGGRDGSGGRGSGGVSAGGQGAAGSGGRGDDASAGGAPGSGGALDGGADAGLRQQLFVSPTGDDTSAGTREDPLLTIAHAATIAENGDTIVLLPGTYDNTTQPEFTTSSISVPAGVSIVSDEPRAAELVGTATAFVFQGGGTVTDVVFDGFSTAIRATTGSLEVSGTSFPDCGGVGAALELSGDVEVTLSPGALDGYVSPETDRLALVTGSAKLAVEGGHFTGMTATRATSTGVINLGDSAEVTLTDVTFENNAQPAVVSSGEASLALTNVTIRNQQNPALTGIELGGSSSLVFAGSRLLDNYWAGISTLGPAKVVLSDCEISNNGAWGVITNAPGPTTVSVTNCTFENNANSAVETRTTTAVSIAGSRFLDGRSYGLVLGAGSTLELRGTRAENNVNANLYLQASADLGTVTEAGGNTFLGSPSAPGLLIGAGAAVTAVGNTWVPNVQGASASGKYSVTGAGTNLTETWAASHVGGANYRLGGTGASVRVAENP